ncbi:ATP-binding protein [Streptomyces sp. RB6PN25]|uniref:ATP-binding protein n=1 Tax=Streptomyces humicola TaxID=2953240 RepID=A0ABT1PWB7_9ACTN|nr:ATP-binding protein [Streptomyces humicola]MCQ4081960.1 ATP-binding protein [Streptomyces humicola]
MRDSTQRFFDATPESVALARDFTTNALAAWGLTRAADDVRLCVSELASNALVHGTVPGYGFLVRLVVDDDFVRLEVHDSRDHRPQLRHPADTDTCGRGLMIVEELSDGWGVEGREPSGKVVWSRFKAASADRGASC